MPDLFTPNQSLPTATEEQAVLQYAATRGTCKQVAESVGVSATTVWRWVQCAASRVEPWVSDLQDALVGSYVAVQVDDTLRTRWRRRRLRLEGKVTQLLLLDRLPWLVKQCRATVTDMLRRELAWSDPVTWPATCLGFCRQVLPGLAGSNSATHKPEKRGSFQAGTVGHGGEPHG
ncbi:MAG TPA: transposase family protein [Symbiobacteriaceae bacterium]